MLWAFVIFNATFALSGVVRSTGAVWPPLAILFFSMVCVRVPFAYLMIPHFGKDAIWWSFPLGTLTSSALTALYYRYGNWRRVRMLHHVPGAEQPDATGGVPVIDPPDPNEAIGDEVLAS